MALLVSPEGAVVALREDPPVLLRAASTASTPAGDRVVTVDGRRRARDAVRLLRPALPRALPRSPPRTRTSSSSSPTGRTQRREHWRTLLRARAIENQAYVAGVNRAGEGDRLRYAGDSAAIAPLGETLAEAGPGEQVLFADVDPAVVAKLRARFPALKDRRPSAYRR